MADQPPTSNSDSQDPIKAIGRRLDRLTVAVVLMALVTFLSAATVYGLLTHYFAGEAVLVGGVGLGGSLLGFGLGWFAGRRFG